MNDMGNKTYTEYNVFHKDCEALFRDMEVPIELKDFILDVYEYILENTECTTRCCAIKDTLDYDTFTDILDSYGLTRNKVKEYFYIKNYTVKLPPKSRSLLYSCISESCYSRHFD